MENMFGPPIRIGSLVMIISATPGSGQAGVWKIVSVQGIPGNYSYSLQSCPPMIDRVSPRWLNQCDLVVPTAGDVLAWKNRVQR